MKTSQRQQRGVKCPVALVGLLLCLPAIAQETSQPATQPGGLPAPLSGFNDEGRFVLYVNEERIATIEFTWKPDGTFENNATISMAGQSFETQMRIEPNEEGRWKRILQTAPTGDVSLERDGAVATRKHKDKTRTITMKPDTLLFENFAPALISQAVMRYDQDAGGKQTFPLFILPAVVMDASLERIDAAQRVMGGRDVEFARYTYGLPGVDITIWTDSNGRLCLADVPAQHAAYVREGYESLRAAPVTDEKLSKPEYDVIVEKNVMVPMRDGVRLATDLYRADTEEKCPVILVRTPYQKNMSELQARYYARRGYVAAIQDCRGRFASEGQWEPFMHEAKDGYDTIEWLAGQPWSSGKVGMIGASYLGWVQWWAASANPPHLVTIVPNVAPPDPFYNIPYEYGVHFMWGAIWWADVLESEATADLSGVAFSKISDKKYGKLLRSLPVIDLDEKVLGKKNRYWREWIAHPTNDEYWRPANFLDRLENTRIPVFHQSGWFDGDGIGSKLNYLKMRSHGHPYQKLVLGPWGHSPEAHRIPDHDFGPPAIIDLQTMYLRWLDYWLKGIDNGILEEPLVKIFVMGANEWLHGDVYPLPQTRFEKWYLTSAGSANTSSGDGRLSPQPPSAGAPPDRYTYDPGDPTPNPEFYEESEEQETQVRSVEQQKKEREAHHENVTQARPDVLVYSTDPLTEPLTFAGPVSARLYAASSARDTDWFVRLMEVGKNGAIFPLVEGKLRARFRNSMREPELLEPGRVYEFDIDLWQTGIRVPAGRRLRVEIASASFPLFSRNLNTGGHNETETEYVAAEQTIYHDAEHSSYVLLPVIPASESEVAQE